MEKTSIAGVTFRPATLADAPAVLALMDLATVWLAEQGRTGQWGDGSSSHANNPRRIAQFTAMIESGGAWVALGPVPPPTLSPSEQPSTEGSIVHENEPQVIAIVSVGDLLSSYVPAAKEPERYIHVLLTHRAWKGRGLGSLLVSKARTIAEEAKVGLLRVDCYAGDDGKLVRWYETQGFVKTEPFKAEGIWPGQVLELRL